MIKMLVRQHNVILKHNHFPSRWLDVLDLLDVIIEKKEKVIK